MVRKKDPRYTCPTESTEQITFFQLVWQLYPKHALNVLSIPNGGLRNKMVAIQMKKEGLLAGAPDILVALVRRVESELFSEDGKNCPGLFIEMKRLRGGTVRKNQKEVHAALRAQGYRVEVCRGATAAFKVFEEYVNDPI